MHVSKEKLRDGEYIIGLSGEMTFVDNAVFQHVLEIFDVGGLKEVIIDVSGLKFIDSAGLGMFFIAKDEADRQDVTLILQGAKDQIEKMFTISCFYDVFEIR